MKLPFTNQKAADLFQEERDARIEKVRDDIATRLKKPCSYLSEPDFETLVDKIMQVQLGSERRPL